MNKILWISLLSLLISIFSSNVANSYSHPYPLLTGVDCRRFSVEYNQHGAVLTSGDLKIYLGNSCDAYSPYYGHGSWGWANGGVAIYFPSKTIGFPRQEVYIRNCRM